MKLALLGVCPDVYQLVEEATKQKRHELVAIVDAPEKSELISRCAPQASWNNQWESLLIDSEIDVVIVSGDPNDDERADQLRKLVAQGVSLLVIQPACLDIVGYELEMIRQDTQGLLMPYIPGALHPAFDEIEKLLAEPEAGLGALEQLVVEQTMEDRGRSEVLAQLSRDVEWLQRLAGPVGKVSAMSSAAETQSFANLTVNMTCSDDKLVRWSVGPVEGEPQGRLVIIGSRGKVTLTMPADQQQWNLEVTAGEKRSQRFEAWQEPRVILEQLSHAKEGGGQPISWSSSCRDLEVAGAVQRSLKKGRNVELLHEEPSEEKTFKGVMAVGGCAILLAALLFVLGLALFEGVVQPFREEDWKAEADESERPPRAHILLRLWPFYPFAIFLLLQLLRLVFYTDTGKKQPAAAAQDEAAADQQFPAS